jgi:hypothetical protein
MYGNTNSGPSLDLQFAKYKSLEDYVTGKNLITFTRGSAATYVDSNGVIQTAATDEPRFDHDPVTGESLGLLVEESRTNLLKYSSDLVTNWVPVFATKTATAATAPNGVLEAIKLMPDATIASHYVYQTVSTGGAYTFSTYVKAAGYNIVSLYAGGQSYARFNLATGSVIGENAFSSSRIENLTNGWFRISAFIDNIGASAQYRIYAWDDADFGNYSGDGTSGIYIWGAQLEAGSFPTSYIPTSGSTVTRAVDVASITGSNFSSWYNQSEGTIVASFPQQTYATGGAKRILSFANDDIDSMSAGSGIIFGSHTGGVTEQRWRIRGDVVRGFSISTGINNTGLAYAANDSAMVFDGGTVETIADVSLSVSLDRLKIFPLNANISRFTYFPTRLSNALLQKLTK